MSLFVLFPLFFLFLPLFNAQNTPFVAQIWRNLSKSLLLGALTRVCEKKSLSL